MKRAALGALLGWMLSQEPGCAPAKLVFYDAYINGPGTGGPAYVYGYRHLPPTQTSLDFAPTKPVPNCAIAWRWPVAVDINDVPLPDVCQPYGFTVDGVPLWTEGA